MNSTLIALSLLALFQGDDWPAAGGDAGRSNSTTQDLAPALRLRWTWRAAHPPMPAWPASDRQPFDRASHPVLSDGILAFGSSADGKVTALDAATGRERWSVFTGGPVRLAPAAWKDRLFVASDDGHLYCFRTATGEILWKKRGGPDDRKVLGNDRLISQWPARGGPVVADHVVYFAAGIWPSDGIFLYALDAASGKVLWCNDQSGSITMPQPHSTANAESGVSAQGNLVVAGDLLLVPTGRAVPAAFRRSDGKFEYFHLQENGQKGGTTALALGSIFFNGGFAFDTATGAMAELVGPGALAAFPGGLVRSTEKELFASAIVAKEKTDRKGERVKFKGLEKRWSLTGVPGGTSVLVAGKTIVAGGAGRIAVIDSTSQRILSTFEVDGAPYGLAAAGGRLYVATDKGVLSCYDAPTGDEPRALLKAQPPEGETGAAAAAKEILEKSGVTEGYCVDLGCGDGALALELARRSKLQIHAIESDPAKVDAARRRLEAAGLYGVRVTVHHADPAKILLPRYFANLVVSGSGAAPEETVARVQRPFGGVAMIGAKKNVRGPLAGAGNWSHAYADPANTSCSSDTLVRGPLTMHWFRDSDFEMPQRHGRGPAPLTVDGRLIVEGLHGLRAVDAYNGRLLWEVSLPKVLRAFNSDALLGAAATGSNLCASSDAVFVHTGKKCLRLDPATGRTLAEFDAPALPGGKPGLWGYIACENGVLYGTLVNPDHIVKWRFHEGDMTEQYTESVRLFAMDASTGKLKWSFDPKASIRHNAIAIGGGRIHLIDRPLAEGDKLAFPKGPAPDQPAGELVTLDAVTGRELWRTKDDVFGTVLMAGVRHDTLLMSYQPTRFSLPSEKGGRLAAFRASDGKRIWDKKAAYKTRPVLVDRTIYAQGGAWDLLTGDEQAFDLQRSYGCGQIAASAHLTVYRSATLGYHDLASSQGTTNYGGMRLGCWINAIPAGGLVLIPDATTGCRCSYLNQAWVSLQPRD